MPIKFRCSYCRQFLGISRGRAGDIVDCPTCGRGIRVPGLDGVIAAVPAPELNVRDARLSRALDELAQWNAPQPGHAGSDVAAELEAEIPQPIAEPIPIEVPIAPEPVAAKPPPSLEPRAAESSDPSRTAAAEPAFTIASAIAELAHISAVEPHRVSPDVAPRAAHHALPRSARWKSLALTAGLAFATYAAGFFTAEQLRTVDRPPESVAEPAPIAGEPLVAGAIAGRITYKTPAGESLPDRGARVLILPREREGTTKLTAQGFRAADHPADVRLAQAALRSLGGDLAVTDDGGKFSLQLPNPGTFQIVVVSNSARRNDQDEIAPELLRVLTPYFDQPAQVVGRTQVHFGQVRYKGTGTEMWDHSF